MRIDHDKLNLTGSIQLFWIELFECVNQILLNPTHVTPLRETQHNEN